MCGGRPRAGAQARDARREMRLAVDQPEEHQLGIIGRVGQTGPFEPAIVGHHGIEPVEPQQPRAPVAHRRRQRIRIVAQMVGAVERATGEPGRDHFL